MRRYSVDIAMNLELFWSQFDQLGILTGCEHCLGSGPNVYKVWDFCPNNLFH